LSFLPMLLNTTSPSPPGFLPSSKPYSQNSTRPSSQNCKFGRAQKARLNRTEPSPGFSRCGRLLVMCLVEVEPNRSENDRKGVCVCLWPD
jgi:hypothetical protein